jgi:NAD(P)-dependent dehydrogenase (short-subunit alcohol dehydrogenase family)
MSEHRRDRVSQAVQLERAVVIGASGGIGSAMCRRLGGQGVEVHALTRSGRAPGPNLRAGTIDIEDEASIAAAASTFAGEEPLDLIMIASGLLHGALIAPEKSYRQLSAASFERYFAVNATGPALVAKHFLPLLRKDRPAVFAALSARVGSIGDNRLGGWHGYRASKAALNMIVKTLAIELARTHPAAVCVALHPGTVATDLSAPFQSGVSAESLFTPETAAKHLLVVVTGLRPSDSGGIFAWDGAPIEP